jgi:hypothetical protein
VGEIASQRLRHDREILETTASDRLPRKDQMAAAARRPRQHHRAPPFQNAAGIQVLATCFLKVLAMNPGPTGERGTIKTCARCAPVATSGTKNASSAPCGSFAVTNTIRIAPAPVAASLDRLTLAAGSETAGGSLRARIRTNARSCGTMRSTRNDFKACASRIPHGSISSRFSKDAASPQ